jgi:NitT/TauT family transport system ATP-binding protein
MNNDSQKVKIKAENILKIFKDHNKEVTALKDLNIEIYEGEFTIIVGPSGCGKSSLLNMIAGFKKPTSGTLLLNNKPITKTGNDRGFVFQEFVLYPWKTVLGNVKMPLEIAGMDDKEAKAKAMDYIKLVGLEGFENAYPHTLSGGMKQRVGLARALVYDPEVLLLDEPFGALDAQTRKLMQQELVKIWQQVSSEKTKKKTVLFVTHSVIEAVYLADRILVMSARPGHIKKIIDVPIPRPRSYTSQEYMDKRQEVLSYLEEEVTKAAAQKSEEFTKK